MNPYRTPDEISQAEAERQKKRAQLAMFGVRQRPDGEWVPVLERQEVNPCRECRGYGTYGNPLAGAVYNCKRCEGSGTDPEPEPTPVQEPVDSLTTEVVVESKPHQSFWQRLVNWWK